MADEELKKKCKERAKIFQQAMESCHNSSPIDCIEWFADRIAELEEENAELKEYNKYLRRKRQGGIQKQYNKVAIIKQQDEQLTKAKEIIKAFLDSSDLNIKHKAEEFLGEF